MEPQFRTSFIPKQSIAQPAAGPSRVMSFVTLAALVVFLLSLSLALSAFLYEQFLKASIARKGESLARAEAAFDPALLQELTRLDARINAADVLLGKHVAVSVLFKFLEEGTLSSVRFNTFSYTETADNRVTLSMKGEASSFAAVALQSDVLGKSRYIREPIFSNLTLNQEGNVVFDFISLVSPDLVSFARAPGVSSGGQAPVVVTPAVTP